MTQLEWMQQRPSIIQCSNKIDNFKSYDLNNYCYFINAINNHLLILKENQVKYYKNNHTWSANWTFLPGDFGLLTLGGVKIDFGGVVPRPT